MCFQCSSLYTILHHMYRRIPVYVSIGGALDAHSVALLVFPRIHLNNQHASRPTGLQNPVFFFGLVCGLGLRLFLPHLWHRYPASQAPGIIGFHSFG